MRCRVTYQKDVTTHEYATREEAISALGHTRALMTMLTTKPETLADSQRLCAMADEHSA